MQCNLLSVLFQCYVHGRVQASVGAYFSAYGHIAGDEHLPFGFNLLLFR